jgi:hypothetical protein
VKAYLLAGQQEVEETKWVFNCWNNDVAYTRIGGGLVWLGLVLCVQMGRYSNA